MIVKSPPIGRDQRRPPIFVLVVCPTRELAAQAAAEATKLLKYHPSIGVQVVIGGTRLALEQKRMQANPCQVLFFICDCQVTWELCAYYVFIDLLSKVTPNRHRLKLNTLT